MIAGVDKVSAQPSNEIHPEYVFPLVRSDPGLHNHVPALEEGGRG